MTLEVTIPIVENDKATPYFEDFLYEISLVGVAVSDATASTVSVASADATDLASAITLANETKADVNTLVADVNSAITQLNAALASLRTAGKIDE